MNFQGKLDKIVKKNNSLLCVGLDSDYDKIPERFERFVNPQFEFNKWVINQTQDYVCAFKPNSAFYEAQGAEGIEQLKLTCDYLKKNYPEIPIILDAKRGDIGSSNDGYVKYAFDYLKVDAITLHPYLGKESLHTFFKYTDKGFFVLCRTSNPGSGELQNVVISGNYHSLNDRPLNGKQPLYQYIARQIAYEWNEFGNCMLVVGATFPGELSEVRKIVGDMTLLVPGVGDQGGDVKRTLQTGLNSKKAGMIINSSRGIIFAKDPKKETKKLRDEINRYRK